MGHTLSDNRHGLVVSALVTTADGHAEREAAKVMVNDAWQVVDDAKSPWVRTGGMTRPSSLRLALR
ncbi:hypothetical protein CS8_071280 [Cupriavidus sp. 8B]